MKRLNTRFGEGGRCRALILAAALAAMILALPQPKSFAAPPTPAQVAQARADLKIYYGWINAPWTGDDQPYQNIRAAIERKINNKENPFDLLKQYEAAQAKAPSDSQAQFAYYYTAYQAVTWPEGDDNNDIGLRILGSLSTALTRSPHPRTYNYARLAFLCEMYNWPDPNLRALGLRLVRRAPGDYDVRFYTAQLLANSAVPADYALALTYAQDLAGRYPKKPSAHTILGYVHYRAWQRTKDQKEAAQAISEYQQYLQLAPSRYSFRKQAEKNIAQMQRG